MKTTLLTLACACALTLTASAQILHLGEGATLLTDPPDASPMGLGSIGWTWDPIKDVVWIQTEGAADFAYIVRDATGLVVTPMDDYIEPFGNGRIWQEGSVLPEQVWLRVYLSDDLLAAGDPMGDYLLRSVRFGFDRPGAGPFEVPEPGAWALIAGLGLVGFSLWRRSMR